jgi:hypothetical protein
VGIGAVVIVPMVGPADGAAWIATWVR